MKLKTIAAAVVASAVISGPVLAGNDAPAGPHYNLNIIGMSKAKNADMNGNNGHRIFVALGAKDQGVKTNIWLEPGDDFKVCDANGFDAAYDCNGEMMSSKDGATFQLPCNNNIDDTYYYMDLTGDGDYDDAGEKIALDAFIGCNVMVDELGNEYDLEWLLAQDYNNLTDAEKAIVDSNADRLVPEAEYEVWARALGKPGGEATVTTCATVQGELDCSMENTVQTRTKGKSTFTDVTNELTSLVVSYCWKFDESDGVDDGVFREADGDVCTDYRTTRIALFAGDTEDWFWEYDNKGLKIAQLRFYYLEDIK